MENTLSDDQGEYDSQYTMNAGSYYDKMYASMLFTESADNFVSANRTDLSRRIEPSTWPTFSRWLPPMLANALTGDDFLKGPRLAASANGQPLVDVRNTRAAHRLD